MEFDKDDLRIIYDGLSALYKQLAATYDYMQSDVFSLAQRIGVMNDMIHVDTVRTLIAQRMGQYAPCD